MIIRAKGDFIEFCNEELNNFGLNKNLIFVKITTVIYHNVFNKLSKK